MLTLYGPGAPQGPVDVAHLTAIPDGVVWIDLLEPTKAEEALAEQALGSDIPTRDDLLEIEPSSRLYEEDGEFHLTVSVLHGVDERDPATDPIGFILKNGRLVTVRYIDPRPMRAVAAQSRKIPPGAKVSPQKLLTKILDALIDRLADELENSGGEVKAISDQVFALRANDGRKPEKRLELLLRRIGEAQRLLSAIRLTLVSTYRAVTFLGGSSLLDGDAMLQRHATSMIADVSALTDHSSFLGENLTFLLDATLGLISLEQNQVMKIFSVVAVVLMPPTLIAGIYGMNFKHMPELAWLAGYPYALLLILASMVLPYWFFRRRGWL